MSKKSKDIHRRKEPFKSNKEARIVLSKIDWDESVLESAKRLLSDLMTKRPFEVYAVALHLLRDPYKAIPETIAKGLEDIARSAARNSLRDPRIKSWKAGMNVEPDVFNEYTSYYIRCDIDLIKLLMGLMKETDPERIWYDPGCKLCHNTKQSPTWWANYWGGLLASVGECPCEEPFKDNRIWNSTLEVLKLECPTCYKTAKERYPRFKEKVIQMVTDIIDGVSIHPVHHVLPAKSLISIPQVGLNIAR